MWYITILIVLAFIWNTYVLFGERSRVNMIIWTLVTTVLIIDVFLMLDGYGILEVL